MTNRNRSSGSSRRRILRLTAASLAASGLPAWFTQREQALAQDAAQPPKSPNDKPGILLVGCGGQGRGDTRAAEYWGNVLAVCDVDQKNAAAAREQFEAEKSYTDFREAIQHKGVDVVVNGTPDHWHTLINLAAVKAGKDVYAEKPLTLTIDEGKRLVKAVSESKRILQTGTQQRSEARFRLACELVRNGRIGKLRQVTSAIPAGLRKGPFNPKPVPAHLNWDFYQGQAPAAEYAPERTHLYFRYWWEYSGGTMTDWGAHHNDIALWGIGQDGPLSIEGKVLIEPIPGGFTTPSQYRADFVFADDVKLAIVSTTSNTIFGGDAKPAEAPLPDLEQNKLKHGVKFEGTDGWIRVTRGRLEASKPELIKDPLPENRAVKLYVSKNHMENFFDCVKSRKPTICDAPTGHRAVTVSHLANIAIRLGRQVKWDPAAEQFINDPEAAKMMAREMRKPYTYEMI